MLKCYCWSSGWLSTCRYPDREQQELFFRHYMAEDAVMQAKHGAQQQPQDAEPQQQDAQPKRGPLAWLRRFRRHKSDQQQQQQSGQVPDSQRQVHRLGSMEVPTCSNELPPLQPAVVDQLSASANVWALASHLYWGIWAIIQVRCLLLARGASVDWGGGRRLMICMALRAPLKPAGPFITTPSTQR